MFIYPFAFATIIGIIKPCTDKSGREFPFLLFIKFETASIQNIPYYLIPFSFYNILYPITESLEDIDSFHIKQQKSLSFDLASINELLNNLSLQLSSSNQKEDYDKYIANTLVKEFWERTVGNFNSLKKFIFAKNLISLKSNTYISTIYLNFSSSKNFYKEDLSFFIRLFLTNVCTSMLVY
jgi:hypothetical protein